MAPGTVRAPNVAAPDHRARTPEVMVRLCASHRPAEPDDRWCLSDSWRNVSLSRTGMCTVVVPAFDGALQRESRLPSALRAITAKEGPTHESRAANEDSFVWTRSKAGAQGRTPPLRSSVQSVARGAGVTAL